MTITDATTTLDTAWTEFSTVTITAGKLSDVDTMVSEVQAKLNRGTLSTGTTPSTTDVKRWLARAKQELAEMKGFSFNRKYVYASWVALQYRYALPPDYGGGELSIRDMTNDLFIDLIPSKLYDMKYPDPSEESSGDVLFATIKNNELFVAPPPASADSIELCYDRTGAETTADDYSWLPEIERFRCCDFAIAEGFYAIHDWESGDRYMARWTQGIGKAIKADGKRKWKAMNYQIISPLVLYK